MKNREDVVLLIVRRICTQIFHFNPSCSKGKAFTSITFDRDKILERNFS